MPDNRRESLTVHFQCDQACSERRLPCIATTDQLLVQCDDEVVGGGKCQFPRGLLGPAQPPLEELPKEIRVFEALFEPLEDRHIEEADGCSVVDGGPELVRRFVGVCRADDVQTDGRESVENAIWVQSRQAVVPRVDVEGDHGTRAVENGRCHGSQNDGGATDMVGVAVVVVAGGEATEDGGVLLVHCTR